MLRYGSGSGWKVVALIQYEDHYLHVGRTFLPTNSVTINVSAALQYN